MFAPSTMDYWSLVRQLQNCCLHRTVASSCTTKELLRGFHERPPSPPPAPRYASSPSTFDSRKELHARHIELGSAFFRDVMAIDTARIVMRITCKEQDTRDLVKREAGRLVQLLKDFGHKVLLPLKRQRKQEELETVLAEEFPPMVETMALFFRCYGFEEFADELISMKPFLNGTRVRKLKLWSAKGGAAEESMKATARGRQANRAGVSNGRKPDITECFNHWLEERQRRPHAPPVFEFRKVENDSDISESERDSDDESNYSPRRRMQPSPTTSPEPEVLELQRKAPTPRVHQLPKQVVPQVQQRPPSPLPPPPPRAPCSRPEPPARTALPSPPPPPSAPINPPTSQPSQSHRPPPVTSAPPKKRKLNTKAASGSVAKVPNLGTIGQSRRMPRTTSAPRRITKSSKKQPAPQPPPAPQPALPGPPSATIQKSSYAPPTPPISSTSSFTVEGDSSDAGLETDVEYPSPFCRPFTPPMTNTSYPSHHLSIVAISPRGKCESNHQMMTPGGWTQMHDTPAWDVQMPPQYQHIPHHSGVQGQTMHLHPQHPQHHPQHHHHHHMPQKNHHHHYHQQQGQGMMLTTTTTAEATPNYHHTTGAVPPPQPATIMTPTTTVQQHHPQLVPTYKFVANNVYAEEYQWMGNNVTPLGMPFADDGCYFSGM
ncbi:hypothetical protein EX30DRAFT_169513 [Ascodesmis nigricans]|uniref:Uncharacterized protein n=1 Tax=Ascodesmis nigricans TaxID=341454 RepID=A0A4S2MLS4_9PEZI|nr:hypothetical protein EX30DRAFT_169513 [Ascodesmis nigricans]